MSKVLSKFSERALSKEEMRRVTGGDFDDFGSDRKKCVELGTSVAPNGVCYKVYSCTSGGRTYAEFVKQPVTKCYQG